MALGYFCTSSPRLDAAEPAHPEARAKDVLEKGPFQLRALGPSQRPRLIDLTKPERFAALQASRSASIFAARDERESFGAVVMGLNGTALTAKVTELKGPHDSRIPISEIRLRWAQGVTTSGVTVPDPLLEEQPFQPPQGIAPILWVTVHVPRAKVPAGMYQGTLLVESKGRTASMPITLEVYDFALPNTSYLQSSFWLFRHTIRNRHTSRLQSNPVRTVAFTPDGNKLATASDDGTVKLWDVSKALKQPPGK